MSKISEAPLVDATEYRSLVGGLRYLLNTRPDVAFAGRFLEEPHEDHMAMVKHILRYVAGTLEFGLIYKRKKNADVMGSRRAGPSICPV
jgi:hypothetical protein